MTSNRSVSLQASHCPVYVLAGGRSSRFGSDKAVVDVDGQPLLQRLTEQLSSAGHAVRVVADRPERYAALGVRCLVDRRPEPRAGSAEAAIGSQGPLAGLATALAHRQLSGEGWLLLLNCDLWKWRPVWLEELAQAVQSGVEVVSFVADSSPASGAGFPQPLPGLYHTQLTGRALERLATDDRSLLGLLAASQWRGIVPSIDPRQWSFNTPAELTRLRDRSAADRDA